MLSFNRVVFRMHQQAIQFSSHRRSEKLVRMTNRMALDQAIDEEMARDPKVFFMGADIGNFNGGHNSFKSLSDKYSDSRVIATPLTEQGYAGLACGASLMSLIPIVQFMSMNFCLSAIDQIVNSSAKLRYMSANELSGSIVFRGPNGPVQGGAAQHSQCFANVFSQVPGLITISPYDAQDCKGLLKSAIRCNNPVVFLQNYQLYESAFEVPAAVAQPQFLLPIGKAKIMKEGKHCTIVSYSSCVRTALQAARILQMEFISCEVINLRTIKPMDRECITNSVRKTGRLVTVSDGYPQSGVGAEVIAVADQTCFDYLKGPAERVTAVDIPMPYADILEKNTLPTADTVIRAVKQTMKYK